MCKLNKKAFTLIEVLCSIALFSLMTITAATVIISSFKMKLYNEDLKNYTYFIEGLKNNILYNTENMDLLYMKENKQNFIHKGNINMESLKKRNLREILSENIPQEEPYVVLNVQELQDENKYYSINIVLKMSKDKQIKCEFNKGKDQ
ncbi:type II secretion system protein [Clostridium liquoris]|jgi:prepilin-type N-terminal cleavage/methylation domain-containing protein|nr:type II secretion system protein [Clostridium liquoris]